MPIDEKRQVHFTTTLFALIRESLEIKMRTGKSILSLLWHTNDRDISFTLRIAAEEMDEADNELRDVVCKIWPNHVKKQIKLPEGGTKSLIDLALPPKHGRHPPLFSIPPAFLSSRRTARHSRSAQVNRGQNLCHLHVRRQLPFVQAGPHQRYGKSADGEA